MSQVVTCPEPHFPYNEGRGCYEECIDCGRVAWKHEQADPLSDVRNLKKWAFDNYEALLNFGKPKQTPPPVMKPIERDDTGIWRVSGS